MELETVPVLAGLIGQPRAVRLLNAGLRAPAGAYLFSGPAGVGKREAASLFAAALICPQGCGQCNACSRALRGLHPDVQTFAPEGYTFPVETIREVVGSASQSPMEAQRRVIIIEEADRILERSQNALLKALEEPHGRLVWVLVADSVDAFLPTVVSRCQLIDFVPVAEGALREALSLKTGLSESEAGWMVKAARGNVSLASQLASDPVARGVRDLAIGVATSVDTPEGALAVIDRVAELAAEAKTAREQVQSTELAAFDESSGKARGTASIRKRITDRHKRELRRVETEVFNELCGWMGAAFRDLAAAAVGAPDAIVQIDRASDIAAASGALPASRWLHLAEACVDARLSIRDNANAPLALESLVLEHQSAHALQRG